jgi:hypothetical protein
MNWGFIKEDERLGIDWRIDELIITWFCSSWNLSVMLKSQKKVSF